MTTQVQGKGKKKNKDVTKASSDEFNQIDTPHGHSVVGFKITGLDLADPINIYLGTVFLTGVIQFIYVLLVGTFPFNSFLAGFLSCVTSFVLAVCLKKTGEFKGFLFAHLVLHLAVFMLIG